MGIERCDSETILLEACSDANHRLETADNSLNEPGMYSQPQTSKWQLISPT
jgi:hypothetical protein